MFALFALSRLRCLLNAVCVVCIITMALWAGMLRNVAAVDCLAGEMVRACAIILLFVVALRIAQPHTISQRRCIVAT